jgi:hypothetical protein
MFDAHKNFAQSTVATAPSPATSGTSLVVASGGGASFPAAPFDATVWPAGTQPTNANAEIVRVTNIATDTFTIARAQEGSSARTIGVGDQIAATITAKTITDIETAVAVVLFDQILSVDSASLDTGANGIPTSGYRNLLVVCSIRSTRASNNIDQLSVQLNGDTGTNYNSTLNYSTGSSTFGSNDLAAAGLFAECPGATAPASYFGSVVLQIPRYADTNRKKSCSCQVDYVKALSSNNITAMVVSSHWDSTAAINQIAIVSRNAAQLKAGSCMTIYALP